MCLCSADFDVVMIRLTTHATPYTVLTRQFTFCLCTGLVPKIYSFLATKICVCLSVEDYIMIGHYEMVTEYIGKQYAYSTGHFVLHDHMMTSSVLHIFYSTGNISQFRKPPYFTKITLTPTYLYCEIRVSCAFPMRCTHIRFKVR